MKRYSVISLFSGCGGSTTGYKLAGYKPLLAVDSSEFMKNSLATYRMNHRKTKLVDINIRELSAEKCMELAGIQKGELDLLDGSPPCQGFSTANTNGRSIQNEKNTLPFHMVRLVRGMQPKVFIMENVEGLIKFPMHIMMLRILRKFRNCGYDVKAKKLNARNYGVPQSRPRIFIVGIRNDLRITPTFPTEYQPLVPIRNILNFDGACIPKERREYFQTKNKFFKGKFVDLNKPIPTVTKMYGTGGESPWIKLADEFYLLSIDEAKKACSFPKNYKFSGKNWKACIEQIGNCVPPMLTKAVATHIRKLVFDVPPSEEEAVDDAA